MTQLTSSIREPINDLTPWDCHLLLIFCELQAWGAIDLHQLQEKAIKGMGTLFLSQAPIQGGAEDLLSTVPSVSVPMSWGGHWCSTQLEK